MARTVSKSVPETVGQKGFRIVSSQLSLELLGYLDWRERVYRAAQSVVDEFWIKQSDFADDVGKSTGETSKRLHRRENDQGDPLTMPADWLARFAQKPGALERFCELLLVDKRVRLEPIDLPTSEEIADAALAELPDHRRRQLEKEKGWPKGHLG
jgi:hypothetical protein